MNELNKKQLHVVGLGSAGTQIVNYFIDKGVIAKYTVIHDCSSSGSMGGIETISFKSPKTLYNPESSNPFIISDMSVDLELPGKAIDLFRDDNCHYILVAGLGSYTGTKMTVLLARYLYKNHKDYHLITSSPFWFEGRSRTENSNRALRELKYMPGLINFKLDSLISDSTIMLRDAFTKALEEFFRIATKLIKLDAKFKEFDPPYNRSALSRSRSINLDKYREILLN